MRKKHKKLLFRIILSAALLGAVALFRHLISLPLPIVIGLFLIPYLIAGYDILLSALRNIAHGQIFDENFLMCIATVGAFIIGEYPEAAFVMIFYQAGELFQSIAVGKSRSSISALMDIFPETATVVRDGKAVALSPEEVAVGETLLVLPGERIPIDGIITDGSSELNTMALTGESLPRPVTAGDKVAGGCINISSPLRIQTVTAYEDSTIAKILELVENAASNKAKPEKFITRFARFYTPCVVIGAALLALIPGIITGELAEWFNRALIFLVISCPCALVISVPLSYFGGIGAASKRGILVKGATYLEALSNVDTVAFDKTGTLTRGEFSVTDATALPLDGEAEKLELFSLAAALEISSTHPIAKSVIHAYVSRYGDIALPTAENLTEHPGMGITATVNGNLICAGNAPLMNAQGIDTPEIISASTVLFVAKSGALLGYLIISDTLKDDTPAALFALKKAGVRKTVMLTGDRPDVAEELAQQLPIDEYRASLLPVDKVSAVEELAGEIPKSKKLVFVGDGINDAPVLSRADIGIAMGALGSDAAIEAADVVLMDDKLSRLSEAIEISRRTNRIVIQNIVFALGVKAAFLLLGAIGIANLWLAVFADVGVSVIAILNAMRTLKARLNQ